MTSRLRELIQQLGEAIHESVIESEQIAGVVSDIRRYGFDVLLMLEATIGLNEVAAKESEDTSPGGEEGAALPALAAHLGGGRRRECGRAGSRRSGSGLGLDQLRRPSLRLTYHRTLVSP